MPAIADLSDAVPSYYFTLPVEVRPKAKHGHVAFAGQNLQGRDLKNVALGLLLSAPCPRRAEAARPPVT